MPKLSDHSDYARDLGAVAVVGSDARFAVVVGGTGVAVGDFSTMLVLSRASSMLLSLIHAGDGFLCTKSIPSYMFEDREETHGSLGLRSVLVIRVGSRDRGGDGIVDRALRILVSTSVPYALLCKSPTSLSCS